jgi:uncharacterized delta-60 repeat protein
MPSPRRARSILLALFLTALTIAVPAAQAGPLDLDPGFGAGGVVLTGGTQGGRWSAVHAFADGSFRADGTPDPAFGSGGLVTFGGGQGTVMPRSVIVLPDGRILVAATATAATPVIVVARLSAAGVLDTTFGTGGLATVTTSGGGIRLGHAAVQSDGRIVLAGTHPGTTDAGILARLTANGQDDAGFGSGGQSRVLLGGAPTRLDDVAIDAADRIVVAGWRASSGGAGAKGQLTLARYTAAGALDRTYGTGGTPTGYTATDLAGAEPATYDVEAHRLRLAGDGTATAAATVVAQGVAHHIGVARLSPDGAVLKTTTQDPSPSHITDIEDLVVAPATGALTLVGRMSVAATQQVAVATYDADLTAGPVRNLAVSDGGDDEAYAAALGPDGHTIVTGRVSEQAGNSGFFARLGATGTAPTASFTTNYTPTRPGRALRPGQPVTFDASASADPDGTVTTYAWDLDGDGHADGTGPTITTSFPAGSHGVLLKVTDDTGLTATTGVSLSVKADLNPGVAIVEPPSEPQAGKTFTLHALAGDPDGAVVSYAWDLDGNGSYETATGATPEVTTSFTTAGQHPIGARVVDDEGGAGTTTDSLRVGEGPCVENPVIKIEKAVIVTQGTAQSGTGCFHLVTVDKDGIRTQTYTTDGHFRVNGLEVDTKGTSRAVLTWKRTLTRVPGKNTVTPGDTVSATLTATNVSVVGTYKQTDFAFIDGRIAWDLKGATIGGFRVDANAGIGGLPLKVSGEPKLDASGTASLDILPGTPPELLGKTPSQPTHAVFGPSATAADLAPFSYTVDEIPLGIITLGPVRITYSGDGNWRIEAKASMAVPVPTSLAGRLELAHGRVKMVDLQFDGAITVGPLFITHVGLTIDFGPRVTANENCVRHVGLEDITPYAGWDALDRLLPGYKDYVLAHDGPNQVLFHQLFMNYKTPTFALCGSIGLSVAKLVDATFGFGFARYPSPLPNVFFFHGDGTLVQLIRATIDAEITTEGYVHVGASVRGGYPSADPWIGWDLGLDFEYFREQFNAQAWAKISIIPLDFTAGAELLASNKGIVGCLTFDTVFGDWHPGGGAKWGHGPKLYLFGCDVDDYKVVIRNALSGDLVIGPPIHGVNARTARRSGVRTLPAGGRGNEATLVRYTGPSLVKAHAAQAGGAAAQPIEIPAGLPGTVMGFKGAGGAPHLVLHGPKGETIDTGAGNAPMQTPGVAALKNPATGITEVVVARPSGGRWTVTVAPDSVRLVEAIQADGTVPARITGKVSGRGQDRTLTYNVTGLHDGQHVDFAEVGGAAGSIIGRVSADGAGRMAFHPGEGAAGTRDVQAVVTNADGYVSDRRKLGTYKAPNAPRPAAPKRLTLKRRGAYLTLTWPRDPLAKTTLVELRSSNGLNIARTVKRPLLRLKAPPAGTKLKIALTSTSKTGVLGTPGRFTRTLPKAKHKHKPAKRHHRKTAAHR